MAPVRRARRGGGQRYWPHARENAAADRALLELLASLLIPEAAVTAAVVRAT
jgi:hypothetical protein